MTDATSKTPEAIPAATVVIFRDNAAGGPPEILIQIRSKTMKFAGGMAVFPGGRVDDADFALAETRDFGMPVDEAAHQIAAVRETLEETGLALGLSGEITATSAKAACARLHEVNALAPILEEFGWSLDLTQFTPFARWNPQNERIPRVYDTRFYLANLGTGEVEIEADNSETTRLFWTTAQGALDMADTGEIKLIFPTRRNLERLALFADFPAAKAQAEAIPVKTIIPQIDDRNDKPMLTIMEDAGYPITSELLETVKRG
ncbi:MAG: NUDIX domain-containing protein [Erythrobacter sp.]